METLKRLVIVKDSHSGFRSGIRWETQMGFHLHLEIMKVTPMGFQTEIRLPKG